MTGVEIQEVEIAKVPKNSELVIIGDWYKKPGQIWRVVCYFYNDNMGYFRRSFPVEVLTSLNYKSSFSNLNTDDAIGLTSKALSLSYGYKLKPVTYQDLPECLLSAKTYLDQFKNGRVFNVTVENIVYWIPAVELARVLFFRSSEIIRVASNEGNTWQLCKSWVKDRLGFIELSSSLPIRYMKSKPYRDFFTWLLFNSDAEKSYCSIFKKINGESRISEDHDRWPFSFDPPDFSDCSFHVNGHVKSYGDYDHFYVRTIESISGLKMPDLDVVYFSHQLDKEVHFRDDEVEQPASSNKNRSTTKIKSIDLDSKPKSSTNKSLIKVDQGILRFSSDLKTKRAKREKRHVPLSSTEGLGDIELIDTASYQQGSDKGKLANSEVDNTKINAESGSINNLENFELALDILQQEYLVEVEHNIGEVPRMRCRSQHLVGDKPRRYCHAIISRNDFVDVHILEIELSFKTKADGTQDPESLSTLLFVPKKPYIDYEHILCKLMSSDKAERLSTMSWKRKDISKITKACTFLGHQDKESTEQETAWLPWARRIAEAICEVASPLVKRNSKTL